DRPVYRPSHTVHFKAILRTQSGLAYQVPSIRNADMEIEDPDQKIVYRKALPISRMGAVQGEFVLPAASALGYYSIRVQSEEATTSTGFQVEEYKKPEYEVRVAPAKARVLQGETV